MYNFEALIDPTNNEKITIQLHPTPFCHAVCGLKYMGMESLEDIYEKHLLGEFIDNAMHVFSSLEQGSSTCSVVTDRITVHTVDAVNDKIIERIQYVLSKEENRDNTSIGNALKMHIELNNYLKIHVL